MPDRRERLERLAELERVRGKRVIAYVLGDRAPTPAFISQDAIRPLFDHARKLKADGCTDCDLFLYSRGGETSVPWPIVTMLREIIGRFDVLVPFRAHSAATMIALGSDDIVMSRKAELGPIDPILMRQLAGDGGTLVQEQLFIEDTFAYLMFIKQSAGISDQEALAKTISILA